MNNREAILFIGKCLTLEHYPERIEEVRKSIQSGVVEWETIVWVSTSHLIFPSIYLQFNRAGLLPELPPELVDYMEEYTDLNRERNKKIIEQAYEITALLQEQGITPVFLKGTAHLLDGLYEDIGERTIGDIDFLVHENELIKAADILLQNGYEPLAAYDPQHNIINKHFPRVTNDNRTAAVEIHHQLLHFPFHKSLEGESMMHESRQPDLHNPTLVPSLEHQVLHNILNVQVNDDAYFYGRIFLRQLYDLFLLSSKVDVLKVVEQNGRSFHRLNANLAIASILFDNPPCIPYKHTLRAKIFCFRVMMKIDFPVWGRLSGGILYIPLLISNYVEQLFHSLFEKEIRHSVFKRMVNPQWYREHLKRYYSKKD